MSAIDTVTSRRDAAVLAVLRERDATRPEISIATGLSKPTVSQAVTALEATGLVVARGRTSGPVGRKPTVYAMDAGAHIVAGVDIGGTNTRVAVADLRGRIVVERTVRTTPSRIISQVHRLVELARSEAADQLGHRHDSLATVVVSTPGVISDGSFDIRLAHNVHSDGRLDLAPLQQRLGAPIRVENNVNLAAVGESMVGAAQHVDTFLHVSIGAGIGLATIHRGRLLRGAHGAAGEICYLPIGARPFAPAHVARGNFEIQTAAAGLLERARRACWTSGPPRDVADLFARAEGGDVTARRLVRDEGRRIGLAVVAARTIVDPDLVVLGGGIGRNELLIEPVSEVCNRLLPLPCPVVTSALADRGSLVGAVMSAADDVWLRLIGPARSNLAKGMP